MYVTKVGKEGGKDAKGRTKPWLARDRADGKKKYFETRKEAEEFAADYNSLKMRRDNNLPLTNKELKKHTAWEIVLSYGHDRPLSDDELDKDQKQLRDELLEAGFLPENIKTVLWSFTLTLSINISLRST
jgi:hypothetical protein